jgi:hypothetical protein
MRQLKRCVPEKVSNSWASTTSLSKSPTYKDEFTWESAGAFPAAALSFAAGASFEAGAGAADMLNALVGTFFSFFIFLMI